MRRLVPLFLLMTSCGYTFQNSRSPLAENEGIRKVYIAPVVNNSYKAGVENVVYNALIKILTAQRRVKIVNTEDEADAILQGKVDGAAYTAATSRAASQLNPAGSVGVQNLTIPSEYKDIPITDAYNATLSCNFTLVRKNPPPGKRPVVWASGFTRTKLFQSANQLGALGNTAGLIDDSEFERSLVEIAKNMMYDVHESMLVMF
jgi:hypothetical protein